MTYTLDTKFYSPRYIANGRGAGTYTLAQILDYSGDTPYTIMIIERRATMAKHDLDSDEEYEEFIDAGHETERIEDHLRMIDLDDVRDLLDDPNAEEVE
ncbi:hypothetical protein [Auritidibacter ignavus]|uniref:hypothetical protein n=1 Tax=Auritidibacter ignavus TaxID=678932 RepID=UPI000F01DBFE|nr:hypothetical protein [Auritidibacter ignavus]NIH70473.1 hypothetical protein [Auritidibacter ignavus]RMX23336.1 hypothetical protein DYI20_05570 [Auritidibacter ignavus]